MSLGFVTSGLVLKRDRLPVSRHVSNPKAVTMQVSTGKPAFYGGIVVLVGVLANRIVLTPLDSLAMTQSRSDILGVIAGATLLLYGVGKAEIAVPKKAVEMGGNYVSQGFDNENVITSEIEWVARTIFLGLPNIRSFALVGGKNQYFLGMFRNTAVKVALSNGETIDNAIKNGKRAYLADMKVVPVKDTEFGFLPTNCQVRDKNNFNALSDSEFIY